MKVLILNGSPRRHGNMSKMLELMKQELEGPEVAGLCISLIPWDTAHVPVDPFRRIPH